MSQNGYSMRQTLHELPAAFVNQIVSLAFQSKGIEVELASIADRKDQEFIREMNETITRKKSWLLD
jgi:hypothetical protein